MLVGMVTRLRVDGNWSISTATPVPFGSTDRLLAWVKRLLETYCVTKESVTVLLAGLETAVPPTPVLDAGGDPVVAGVGV